MTAEPLVPWTKIDEDRYQRRRQRRRFGLIVELVSLGLFIVLVAIAAGFHSSSVSAIALVVFVLWVATMLVLSFRRDKTADLPSAGTDWSYQRKRRAELKRLYAVDQRRRDAWIAGGQPPL